MTALHILIPFHDFARGGTERVALTLASHWLDAGHRVTILCGSRAGGTIDQVDPRVEIISLDPELPRSALSRLRLGPAMAPTVARLAPDAVYIPGNFHFIVALALRRALPDLVIVGKVSNPLLPGVPGPLAAMAGRVLRHLRGPMDALVYMAPELAEEGRRLLPRVPAEVIAEPNLPAGYVALPRTGPEDSPLIVAVARLEPQKNLALALAAFAQLRRQRPARLAVLGEGAERQKLETLARKLGIAADVAFPGYTPDVPEWLARASALLLSSHFEGYPAVVVEALAADVPVVATNCTPTLAGLISYPLCGEIVDPPSPRAMAEALSRALDLPFSSNGARPSGVAHHDARASAAAYTALFARLAAARRAG